MVSTGDNNGGTPPAEAMPEAVREAAMKVAAWLNGSASKPEGEGMAEPAAAAYTVPAPEQLTRDVLNALVLDFKQRDSAAHTAPTLTEDHSLPHDDGISRAIATVEHEQLKAAKHSAIIDIEAAIARATDPESQAELKELLELVKNAKSSGGLRDVLASASTAVANAIGRADSGKIDLKSLAENDPILRAKLEAIERKWEEESKVFTGKQDKMDKLAADKEIETTHDKARTDIEEKIAELKKRGATIEDIAAAEAERAKILVLQNQERERVAREKGDSITADEFHRHEEPSKEYLHKARTRIEDLKALHIEALERRMQGAPSEDIKAMRMQTSKIYDSKLHALSSSSVEETDKILSELEEKANIIKNSKEAHSENGRLLDLLGKAKFTATEANLKDGVIPASVPSASSDIGKETGKSGF